MREGSSTYTKTMNALRWEQNYDDKDNPYYEAASQIHDEGSPFMWKVYSSPEVGENGRWEIGGDEELTGSGLSDFYADALEAAITVQKMEDEMVKSAAEEWDALSPEEQAKIKQEYGY